MKEIHLIVVGKLKDKNIESLEDDYLKRVKAPKLQIHEVKAQSENLDLEGQEVEKKINDISKNGSAHIVLLSEWGVEKDSLEFSNWLENLFQAHSNLIFVIGGAAGHGKNILDLCHSKLSLGKMTYPHKLARLLFVEQVYRAQTIRENHPYHKN
ncbi:MAG: 23S rRNA (pseudouridine(1915)-N(3))-methyltransferase RlmH [Bacteriovoracaceae bacterium]|nr:23S rRNA (pseudouridine(1915)-N(3))-methyltransferase RlmH [Bacteriovoracaceae bacterium]